MLATVLGVSAAGAGAWFQRPTSGQGPLAGLRDSRERHLANVRQLTFGGQNAEAYWSFDGSKLIYQMYDGQDVKADQIFTMNADGSGKKRVSNGT
ncbi:MAG: hypothetical protein ACOVT5_05625, partial [Armatimonadaceae bacterium]